MLQKPGLGPARREGEERRRKRRRRERQGLARCWGMLSRPACPLPSPGPAWLHCSPPKMASSQHRAFLTAWEIPNGQSCCPFRSSEDTPIPGACTSDAHQHAFVDLLQCSSLTAGLFKYLSQTSGGIWDQHLFLPPTAAGSIPARAAGRQWQRVSHQEGGMRPWCLQPSRRGGARLLAVVGER